MFSPPTLNSPLADGHNSVLQHLGMHLPTVACHCLEKQHGMSRLSPFPRRRSAGWGRGRARRCLTSRRSTAPRPNALHTRFTQLTPASARQVVIFSLSVARLLPQKAPLAPWHFTWGFRFVAFLWHTESLVSSQARRWLVQLHKPQRAAPGKGLRGRAWRGRPEGAAPPLLFTHARPSATAPPSRPSRHCTQRRGAHAHSVEAAGRGWGGCSVGSLPPSPPRPLRTEGARVFPCLFGAAAFPRPFAARPSAAIPAARREEAEDGGWDWPGGGGGGSGYANEAVGSQRQSRCGPRLRLRHRRRPLRRRTLLLLLSLPPSPSFPFSARPGPPALAPARHGRWRSAVSLCAALRGREPPLPLSGAARRRSREEGGGGWGGRCRTPRWKLPSGSGRWTGEVTGGRRRGRGGGGGGSRRPRGGGGVCVCGEGAAPGRAWGGRGVPPPPRRLPWAGGRINPPSPPPGPAEGEPEGGASCPGVWGEGGVWVLSPWL